MSRIGRWCLRHRRRVLGAWVLALILAGVVSHGVGSAYSNNFTLPGTDTQRALDLLKAEFPSQSGDVDSIVLHTRSGSVDDPAVRSAATAMLAKVADLPHVRAVVSPYTAQGAAQVSRDHTIAYASVILDGTAVQVPTGAVKTLISTARTVRSSQLQVELGGQAIAQADRPTGSTSELVGVLAAALILFLAFGSWRGMITPLITALLAIGIGTSLISVLSHAVSVAQFATELAVLIGLGVGVDYALFIVGRHRTGLAQGLSVEDSVAVALDTSGRAVLFAGATVCVALLGLLLGVSFLVGVALGAAITVALTVLASITLLPALLGFMGPKVLGRKQLRRLATGTAEAEPASRPWYRWAATVQRRRWPLAIAAAVVMLVIAIPFLSLRLGSSDQGNDPTSSTTRQAYDLLADGFGPGFNGPLQVTVGFAGTGTQADLARLSSSIRTTPDVAAVTPARLSPSAAAAVFDVVPRSSPQDVATSDLVHRLRDRVIPAATAGDAAVRVAYVGGSTAAFVDFAHVLSAKLPLFVGVVVLVAFLLLMLAFRSLLIPLVASVMNILAAGAAFGLLVFVFQQGHLGSVFSIGRAGPVESFLPVMLFAILFGLSMDYQVFLVSRMHEEWLRTGDNSEAVRTGQAETGRVITAAASIMIVVFLAFVFGGQRQIAEFGLGLAGAVLLDAFVLRTVLVPAAMHLIGPANWAIPGWLDRVLPHVSIESRLEQPAPSTPDPTGGQVPAPVA